MSLTDYLSTLFLISIFKHMIRNRLLTATATIITPVVIDNGQSSFVLFVVFIHSYNYGVKYDDRIIRTYQSNAELS